MQCRFAERWHCWCAEYALWGIGFAFVDPSKIRGWLRAAELRRSEWL